MDSQRIYQDSDGMNRTLQQMCRVEPDWAASRVRAGEIAIEENEKLRMLLWLRHGCDGLYGDDGEMQCSKCMIDFKRDRADDIERKWFTENEKAIAEYMKQGGR